MTLIPRKKREYLLIVVKEKKKGKEKVTDESRTQKPEQKDIRSIYILSEEVVPCSEQRRQPRPWGIGQSLVGRTKDWSSRHLGSRHQGPWHP